MPKIVLKTTVGQFRRWPLIRWIINVENVVNSDLVLANIVLYGGGVLKFGELNSGLLLY